MPDDARSISWNVALYSNKLDLVFYKSHKLMDYLHHLNIIKISYIYTHIYNIEKTENDKKYMDRQIK